MDFIYGTTDYFDHDCETISTDSHQLKFAILHKVRK